MPTGTCFLFIVNHKKLFRSDYKAKMENTIWVVSEFSSFSRGFLSSDLDCERKKIFRKLSCTKTFHANESHRKVQSIARNCRLFPCKTRAFCFNIEQYSLISFLCFAAVSNQFFSTISFMFRSHYVISPWNRQQFLELRQGSVYCMFSFSFYYTTTIRLFDFRFV